ncbi:MAG: HAMP domain-containing histidine kinase [Bacteroidia bacterium]|nr:HAMP domain-containing histidine kinase [Bacteroidia bacterium]MBP7259689.1 HAMP domain-containing histidine kinase [Bacteroidia bacterium]MBP9179386.1 HAMP domain-containing histidine kinase [Bacteroidia bacterium]MBP9723360.1 HAMP domain-containing histidine kinase [Bacteroidia bacterium]
MALSNLLKNEDVYRSIDEENIFERQRFTLFRIYSFTGALVSFGVYLKMYLMFEVVKPIHLVLPILSLIMLFNFYRVKKTDQLEKAYLVVLLSSFLLLHTVSYSTGGIKSASITYYPVVILTAFMLLGRNGGVLFTSLFFFQLLYIFIVSRYTDLTSFEFLNNDNSHIEEDFLFNGIFTSFLVAAQSAYLFSGRNIVIQKITEQRDKLELNNQLLQVTNTELQKANKELDKFVYSVSHDLRAPLSSILGIVQLTEDDELNDELKTSLGFIKQGVLKLDTFIQDILDYSRNTRAEIKQEAIDFKTMLEDVCDNLKYMAYGGEKKVNLITEITQSEKFISDKSRMMIILNNLLSNGMRYSNPTVESPFVKIQIKSTDVSCNITISDNGIGIKPELQQKVFDMFYRISEKSVGSGLGLYLVKETVEKLNGTVRLDSIPGVGTSFTITLPSSYISST